MKKYFIKLITPLLLSQLTFAQDANFNWRTDEYQMHFNISNVSTSRIVQSPFYEVPSNPNDNLRVFWDQTKKGVPDYNINDGWNLVHYDFGDNIRRASNLPNYPYLILYNKYTSVLRIFCFVRNFSNTNGATIALKHDRGQSAIYASAYTLKSALVDFDNEVLLRLPNYYLNANEGEDDNWWLHADFPMMYDPCGYNTVQSFEFGVVASTAQNISWTTVGTQSTKEDDVTDAAGSQPIEDGYKSSLSEFRGVVQTGIKYTGTIKNLNDKYNVSGVFKKFTEDKKVDGRIADDFADKAKKVIGKVGGSVLKAVPIVGTALSLLDSFVGLFDSSEEGGASIAAVPSKYFINLTSTGTITTDFGITKKYIKVPGSKSDVNSDITPFYNQPVGVFNVLEAPVVEYAEFTGNSYKYYETSTILTSDGQVTSSSYRYPDFKIREYHIKDDIKFAVNPASGLELVDMQTSVYIKHDYKRIFSDASNGNKNFYNSTAPTNIGAVTDIENQFAYAPAYINPHLFTADIGDNNGLEGMIQTTPLMNVNCIKNNSSIMSIYSEQQPEIWVKMVGFFKVAGSTDGKIYTHVHSFKTNPNYVNSGQTGSFSVRPVYWYSTTYILGSFSYWKYAIDGIGARKFGNQPSNPAPTELTIGWEFIDKDAYVATDKININGGALMLDRNKKVVFGASQIEISGEYTSGNEMEYRDYYDKNFGACASQAPVQTDPNYICTKAEYIAKTLPTARLEEEAYVSSEPTPPAKPQYFKPSLKAVPNPTTGRVTFYYKIASAGEVSIKIANVMGIEVLSVLENVQKEIGNYEQELNLSALPTGVYVVTIESNGYKHTERLVLSGN